jgi:hypothetical protein
MAQVAEPEEEMRGQGRQKVSQVGQSHVVDRLERTVETGGVAVSGGVAG